MRLNHASPRALPFVHNCSFSFSFFFLEGGGGGGGGGKREQNYIVHASAF